MEKRAHDIIVLDIRGISGIADFVIIAGGSSDRQISSVANNVIDSIKKHPIGVEGLSNSRWVVIDYGDVIIHVIHDDIRPYYNLEGLWPDAKELIVEKPNSL
ncbi:MAG: ribosome silencing factor [Deltaproteobacteria bacterium]|nr:ribosome silencing factor [Deltaproteobacteria bacterium]